MRPVMRERTTWSREVIAAANKKIAEDPRAMNQDHLQQQPAADAYVIGGPSEFAEDVHPSSGTWKAEQSGGETKRNEIGMPEMRGDTFKHPEKTASDEAFVIKKADLCVKIARAMLKDAADSIVEDQALALMSLSPAELVETHSRLAGVVVAQDDDEDEEEEKGQQDKEAGQMPPALKEYMEGKGDKKDDDKKEEKKEDDKKEASTLLTAAVQAAQAGDAKALQAAISELVDKQVKSYAIADQQQQQMAQQDQMMAQQQDQMMAQQQQEQMAQQQQQMAQQQQQLAQQIEQMVAQQVQQQMAQQQQQGSIPPSIAQQQQQGCGQPMMSDEQMLDQMLAQEMGQQPQMMAAASEMDLQLDGAQMDVGETVLSSEEDALLSQLFSGSAEVRLAAHAQELETGVNPLMSPPPAGALGGTHSVTANVRTASRVQPRTLGTQPSVGVSQLGGAAAGGSGSAASNDIDKLSSMWRSAPDVSSTFNQ